MATVTPNPDLNADGREIRDWSAKRAQSSSFNDGQAARRAGKDVAACPYPKGQRGGHRNAWLDGYATA